VRLQTFDLHGDSWDVEFVATSQVKEGVTCDVYRFTDDATKDLGVVEVLPGFRTPLQRVLAGESTIEGLLRGQGKLTITKDGGQVRVYDFHDPGRPPISVDRGDLMQWHANGSMPLVFYEVCTPPYEAGRFADVSEAAMVADGRSS
jgi:mannose-6-phosphate isomerase-like protein (cupin superfamily)